MITGLWNDDSAATSDRVDALVAAMTLEEKIAQLYGVWVGAATDGGEVAPHQHDMDDAVDLDALLPLLVFNDPTNFTLPLGVATFQSQYSQDTASILAFTALSIVPALVFFIFAERHIVGGLTGSVKG